MFEATHKDKSRSDKENWLGVHQKNPLHLLYAEQKPAAESNYQCYTQFLKADEIPTSLNSW
jgi:hypothetical protein